MDWPGSNDEDGSIHYVIPYPGLLDGRHFTIIAPEFGSHESETGKIRVIDTTDPTNPQFVGEWELPGNYSNPDADNCRFCYSPHNIDLGNGHIYLANYHVGTWVIDISTPELRANPKELGFFMTSGHPEKSYEEMGYHCIWAGAICGIPMNWGAQYNNGYIYVADMLTGIYVLQYDGDVADVPAAP